VCYAVDITAIDPVGMELLFERFLSERRGEWPDILTAAVTGGFRIALLSPNETLQHWRSANTDDLLVEIKLRRLQMNSVPAVSRQLFWICRRKKGQISFCFPKGSVSLFLLET
jgi:hypothetical protein